MKKCKYHSSDGYIVVSADMPVGGDKWRALTVPKLLVQYRER